MPTKPTARSSSGAASRTSSSRATSARPAYAKLVKGYMGFLTGTGKSLSTIGSYKGDLALLEEFLRARKKDFYRLNERDFAAYQVWLEKQGLRTNTRRRKILSAKALVKYAVSRKKMAASPVRFVKAPGRLERLPWIPLAADWEKVTTALGAKPSSSLALRNSIVVHLLAETGLALAELCGLRWDQVTGSALELEGKRPRKISFSAETARLLGEWRTQNDGKHLFPGFNRYGITSEKMTPRGVELAFRALAERADLKNLKPKTLRHYAIARWLREDVPEDEVRRRLGVHPSYSLEAYRKHLATAGAR